MEGLGDLPIEANSAAPKSHRLGLVFHCIAYVSDNGFCNEPTFILTSYNENQFVGSYMWVLPYPLSMGQLELDLGPGRGPHRLN